MNAINATNIASAFSSSSLIIGGAASQTAFSNAALNMATEAPKTLRLQQANAINKASCAGKTRDILIAETISKRYCSQEIDAWQKDVKLVTDASVANSDESQDTLKAATDLSECYFKEGDLLKGTEKIGDITDCLRLFAIGEAYRMGLEMAHSDKRENSIIKKQSEVKQIAAELKALQVDMKDLESTSHLSTEAAYSQSIKGKYTQMWDKAVVKAFKALEANPASAFQWLNNRTQVTSNNAKVTILKPQNCDLNTPLVIVAPGCAEPMRSYKEMAGEFVDDGMAVAVLGFSGNGDIGYTGDIQTFGHYRHVITEMVQNASKYAGFSPKNIHLVAHSVGAYGAMNAFQHNALEKVKSLSLISPMFGLPISGFQATMLAVLTAIKSTFFWIDPHTDHVETPEDWFDSTFEGNTRTQSKQRFNEVNKNRKDTNQAAPTTSWTLSSIRETRSLRDSLNAITPKNKPKFTGKIDIYTGTADRVIDKAAIHQVSKDLQQQSYKISFYNIQGGFHALHQEADPYRQRMISNIHNTIKQTSKSAAGGASKPRARRSRLNFS